MFRWYNYSGVCSAYFSDILSTESTDKTKSVWFTRRWTLQEILAPERVVFFNRDWVDIGTKPSLRSVFSEGTGIKKEILEGGESFKHRAIAERMS